MVFSDTQSCLTLCDPLDCSPPGSSVHGILQARILEWAAIPFSSRSPLPRDWNWLSCIAGRFFTVWATREAKLWHKCTYPQHRNRLERAQRTDLWSPRWERDGLGLSGWQVQTPLYRRDNNKVLLYSTGDYIQKSIVNRKGKTMKKNTHVYDWITLLYSRNEHSIVNQPHFNQILERGRRILTAAVSPTQFHTVLPKAIIFL